MTSSLEPAGFFVLRTPLLPVSEVTRTSGASPPSADHGARAHELLSDELRGRLRRVVATPVVREAIFLASPDLDAAVETWLDDPRSDRGRRAERALVRYVQRMATRSTPFGLFAGCSVGTVGRTTEIRLGGRDHYRRNTRLDMEYVAGLVAELDSTAELRRRLVYHTNNTIYRAAGRLRYVEARLHDGVRSHRLVAVDDTDDVRATLERAHDGATVAELAAPLVAEDVSLDEATAFIHELIDAQLLISELEPCVTGAEPLRALMVSLEAPTVAGAAPAGASTLGEVRERLRRLDTGECGNARTAYREVAACLERLPAQINVQRLFQVDMIKPLDHAQLGVDVVRELERGARLLHALSPAPRETPLDRFRSRFVTRYETAEVALAEVLDEDVGIGFDVSSAPSAEASPLLRDLAFPTRGEVPAPLSPVSAYLTFELTRALRDGAEEMSITMDAVAGLTPDRQPELPAAFAVTATLAAAGIEALRAGDFRALIHSVAGPSGARMLGRFCAVDPGLEQHVRDHLIHEEGLDPAATYAEIVHLPEGRVGNVVQRPLLRGYEIPYLGRSGAPDARQIPVSDLLVSVRAGRVLLRSRRLGCEIVPRLSTAHNYLQRSIGVYKFLCALQEQGVHGQLMWDWGPLGGAAYLPRVVSGRLVLSAARWRVTGDEMRSLDEETPHERYGAVQALRRRLRLPAAVLLADADHGLLCDLDNPLSVETFVHLVKRRSEVVLTEMFPAPDQLWVEGPEGRFASELIVPFHAAEPAPSPAIATRRSREETRIRFSPGSEWLYLKLYCGTATADALLRDVVAPFVRAARADGVVDRWFFVRYGDPDWHLRVRVHGDPARLPSLLSEIDRAVRPVLANGLLARLALDTYEPEVDRYGGREALPLVEAIFEADSDSALGVIGLTAGDAGMDARWRITLRGSDALLDDFCIEPAQRSLLARGLRDGFRDEFRVDASLRRQIARRYRQEAAALLPVMRGDVAGAELQPALDVLAERSRRIAPAARELLALDVGGSLTVHRFDIVTSLIHMHVNRMLRSAHRAHELVLYDFLDRLYRTAGRRA